MKNLLEKYQTEVIPKMREKFLIKNNLAVPKIKKVVLNVGLGAGLKDAKFAEKVEDTLTRISGQKPVKVPAKKSIAGFKIREGMIVGMRVTLRGKRMYDFINKFIHISLPRVRDFWGLTEKSIDQNGNLSLGFKEHIIFPEIKSEEIERLHGLEVTITTNAKDKEKGLALLKFLGFPFKAE